VSTAAMRDNHVTGRRVIITVRTIRVSSSGVLCRLWWRTLERASSSGVLGRLWWRTLERASSSSVDHGISAYAEEGCSSIWDRGDGGLRWYGVNLVGRPFVVDSRM
jgi:hypothetical protein